MNLDRMRVLHAVSTYGSIAAAADVLRITPSAASQQLAKLEREVGDSLLEREGRGVRLTEAARLLVSHAEHILAAVEHARADLERHRGAVHGELSIAAFATAVRGLLPAVVNELHDSYPDLQVRVVEHDPHIALPGVLRGALDLAVTQYWPSHPFVLPDGLSGETLFDDPIDLAVPDDHPLASSSAGSLDQLTDERWISWPAGSDCHQWLLAVLRARGIEPRIAHEAAEHPTQLALVAAGLGVALVPRLGRPTSPATVRFVELPGATRRVQFVWRTGTDQRPSVAAALASLRAACNRRLTRP